MKDKKHGLPRLITENTKDYIEVNSDQMLRANSRYLAVNFEGDTTLKKTYEAKTDTNFVYQPNLPKCDFKVIIDTSYCITANGYECKRTPYPVFNDSLWRIETYRNEADNKIRLYYDAVNELKNKYVLCYPVLIYNNSSKQAFIYDDEKVCMIQEALDIDGKWKPIEFFKGDGLAFCNPLYYFYKISPKHYICSSMIRYKGNFKTKVRVKLRSEGHVYYSNKITGYINRSQFDQSFIRQFLKDRRKLDEKYFEADRKLMFLDVVDFNKLFSEEEQ